MHQAIPAQSQRTQIIPVALSAVRSLCLAVQRLGKAGHLVLLRRPVRQLVQLLLAEYRHFGLHEPAALETGRPVCRSEKVHLHPDAARFSLCRPSAGLPSLFVGRSTGNIAGCHYPRAPGDQDRIPLRMMFLKSIMLPSMGHHAIMKMEVVARELG